MTKKMLLAAVSDYQGFAPKLDAAVEEIDRWSELLTAPPYGLKLEGGIPLTDRTATKKNILAGLNALLKGAQPDDQLLFLFIGHGTRTKGQQAFVAYPEGNPDLAAAAVTYDDVAEILAAHKLPPDVDVTFVLDTCFAEGFGAPPDAVPMFVRTDADGDAPDLFALEARPTRRFAHLAYKDRSIRKGRDDEAGMVIVCASRENEAAFQIKDGRKARTLFSLRAIDRLQQSHDTFDEFVASINPLRKDYPQTAVVHGRADRKTEKFPGEPEPRVRALRAAAFTADAAQEPIHYRILGLGCFIDPAPLGAEFVKRIVLPYDTFGTGAQQHHGFVEVADADIIAITGSMMPTTHYRAGLYNKRWTLSGHRVELENPDMSVQYAPTPAFQRYVPSLPDVTPELQGKLPRQEARAYYPSPSLFNGFIDLYNGQADIGPLEPHQTLFTRQYGGAVTRPADYTPTTVLISQPFTGAHAILLIANIDGSSTAQIFIKPGATILAGNAREADITGNGSGETPREHFLIYYNITSPADFPINPGLPTPVAVTINACTPVKWP